MRRFYAQFVRPGDLCFDLGAHAGNRVRAFRQVGARVVAVEPQPAFARLLRALYGRDPGVTLLDVAVGAAEGEADMLVSPATPTVTTLSAEWTGSVGKTRSFSRVRWEERVRVRVTTLDALIERFGEPAFCKIDVEGYELEVLRGLSQPVRALSLEYLVPTIAIAQGCIERLAALGEYEYNHSVGETHRLALAEWIDGEAMARSLSALPADAPSGDLYARLKGT
jgi:FkbM family methyltransferase